MKKQLKFFHKIIPYKLQRLVPMTIIVGMPLVSMSCYKNYIEPEPEPTREINVEFDHTNVKEQLNREKLYRLSVNRTVRYVHLVPTQHWNELDAKAISLLRAYELEPSIGISSKMRGNGDFDFKPGEPAKVPNDSAWIIQHGWTINQGKSR